MDADAQVIEEEEAAEKEEDTSQITDVPTSLPGASPILAMVKVTVRSVFETFW